jgi:transposase
MEGQKEKKERHANQHYSLEFKRQVIEEYLATGCSKESLLRKYHIFFSGAIQLWMRQLGYDDIYGKKAKFGILDKVLKTENSGQDHKEPEDEASLKKRIKQLERQLEDEKFRSEMYDRMINLAEKQFKITIRKKPSTK